MKSKHKNKEKVFNLTVSYLEGFPGGASGKEPAYQDRRHETQVWSLGQEDPPEKCMVTHSSIVAWRTPQTEEPGRPWFIEPSWAGHDWSDLAIKHAQYLEKHSRTMVGIEELASREQARRATDWRRERGQEAVELNCQQQGTRGRACCSVTNAWHLMVLVPCWNWMHLRIFENLQLEGLYMRDLLYMVLVSKISPTLYTT